MKTNRNVVVTASALLVAGASACTSSPRPFDAANDAPTQPTATPDRSSADSAVPVVIEATDGWTVTIDGASCTHVAVRESCSGGMCRIPAGCFVQGSPEDEQGRGGNAEPLAPITLTHAFEIGQTEVTVEQWSRFSQALPNNRP